MLKSTIRLISLGIAVYGVYKAIIGFLETAQGTRVKNTVMEAWETAKDTITEYADTVEDTKKV